MNCAASRYSRRLPLQLKVPMNTVESPYKETAPHERVKQQLGLNLQTARFSSPEELQMSQSGWWLDLLHSIRC